MQFVARTTCNRWNYLKKITLEPIYQFWGKIYGNWILTQIPNMEKISFMVQFVTKLCHFLWFVHRLFSLTSQKNWSNYIPDQFHKPTMSYRSAFTSYQVFLLTNQICSCWISRSIFYYAHKELIFKKIKTSVSVKFRQWMKSHDKLNNLFNLRWLIFWCVVSIIGSFVLVHWLIIVRRSEFRLVSLLNIVALVVRQLTWNDGHQSDENKYLQNT